MQLHREIVFNLLTHLLLKIYWNAQVKRKPLYLILSSSSCSFSKK